MSRAAGAGFFGRAVIMYMIQSHVQEPKVGRAIYSRNQTRPVAERTQPWFPGVATAGFLLPDTILEKSLPCTCTDQV